TTLDISATRQTADRLAAPPKWARAGRRKQGQCAALGGCEPSLSPCPRELSHRFQPTRLTSAPRLPQRVANAASKSPFCFGVSCPRMGVVGGVRWNYEDPAATRHPGHDRN